MSWQSVTLSYSGALRTAADAAQALLDNADSEINAAVARAQAAPPLNTTPNPLASSANALPNIPALTAGLSVAAFHPYDLRMGVGDGRLNKQLSFSDCVRLMQDKVKDLADPYTQGGDLSALAVGIAAGRLRDFVDKLSAFNRAFNNPELNAVEHRARALLVRDNHQQGDGVILPAPDYRPRLLAQVGAISRAAANSRALLGLARAYERGSISPEQKLQQLAAQKQAVITQREQELADTVAAINDNVFALYAQGNTATIAALLADNAPGPEFSYSAALLFVAPRNALEPLKELFSL